MDKSFRKGFFKTANTPYTTTAFNFIGKKKDTSPSKPEHEWTIQKNSGLDKEGGIKHLLLAASIGLGGGAKAKAGDIFQRALKGATPALKQTQTFKQVKGYTKGKFREYREKVKKTIYSGKKARASIGVSEKGTPTVGIDIGKGKPETRLKVKLLSPTKIRARYGKTTAIFGKKRGFQAKYQVTPNIAFGSGLKGKERRIGAFWTKSF